MEISDLITVDRIACHVSTSSKKRALEKLSELISTSDSALSQNEVFESLVAREKLGSTGLGRGVAIPHGRFKASNKTLAAFVQLDQGVDFDSPDGEPVDLLCALLVPPESTEEHLQVLSSLTEMFRNNDFRQQLRDCDSPEAIFALLTNQSPAP